MQQRQKRRDKRLNEELIESYRKGWRLKTAKGYRKRVCHNQFEGTKNQESMKEMHGGGTKYFNDNLEPLIRYLNSHVGKHWDKVFSELSSKMDKSSVSGLHVFQHLFDFVHTKVVIEVRKVYGTHQGYWAGRELISYEKQPRFYVHPKSGVLMKAKLRKWKS